ncbi:MAG: phosphotransferase [Chloroflexota bacterium]|nr:phosphotransferase [Chloroflexota bacterium]MDE2960339.1 phosphotransferase [Chloroflexota bacterium]
MASYLCQYRFDRVLGNLYRCRLIAGDGQAADPASVIVKLPSSDAMAFRFSRWLSLHRREYVFYRDVAPLGYVRVPTLFYGDFDAESNRFVLVLEDLGHLRGIPQSVGVDATRARCAMRQLAGLQGRFWEADDPALSACGDFLSTRQRRIMQTVYLLTLPAAFDRFGDLFTDRTRRLALEFGFRIAAHFAALSAGPKTVVHGDFRADNMLFGDGEQDAAALIDWQGCGIGCGMYDVAFFLATSVTSDLRRRIERDALDEYHDIVSGSGVENYTREDCWHSYRQNILGTLMPMVIGCGAMDMSDPQLVGQSRELLSRVLTAIEELDSWEFMPRREPFLAHGWGFATLSRCAYPPYRLALRLGRLRKRR